MPRVTLFYGEKQYELEVDEENGLETFFFQVFSVTNVEPESLRLFGLGADPLTLATAGSVPFTLTDGQAVALLEPEPTLTGDCL